MKKENLLNKKYNRLLVIGQASHSSKRSAWLCRCDCGVEKVIKAENLKSGKTKSCGCLNLEKMKERSLGLYINNIKYSPKEATARNIWRKNYKDGLSFDDFYILSQMYCFYCGAAPNNKQNSAKEDKKSSQYAKDHGDFIYNGLDRIDNSKSHLIDNVITCCKWCNYAKRERSVEEFKNWIEKVHFKINNIAGDK